MSVKPRNSVTDKGESTMARFPATPVTEEVLEKVTDIIRQTLDERFSSDEFIFGPIVVKPRIDYYGDEYMEITVVYEGDRKLLDPGWTLGLVRRILPKMKDEGIHVTNRPSKSFIPKHEWEEIQTMDPYDELG